MNRKILIGVVVLYVALVVGLVSSVVPQPVAQPGASAELSDFLVPRIEADLVADTSTPPPGEVVKMDNIVSVDVYRPVDGSMVLVYHHESHNVITNVGLYAIARQLNGQTAAYQWTPALGGNNKYYRSSAINYIALSIDDTGVDADHSSWQAVDSSYGSDIEITTGGLQRATSTFTQGVAYTAGAGDVKGSLTFTLAKTFTVDAGASFTGVQKAGLFNAAYSAGNGDTTGAAIAPLVAENIFTPVDLNGGDQIAITWRITL